MSKVDVSHILPWLALAIQHKFGSTWFVSRLPSGIVDDKPNGVSFRALRMPFDIRAEDNEARGRLEFEVRITPSGADNNVGMRFAANVQGWLRQAQFDVPEAMITAFNDKYGSNYPVPLPTTIGYLPVEITRDAVPYRDTRDREAWVIECSCLYWYDIDVVPPTPLETTLTQSIVVDVNGTEITVD